MEIYGSSGLTTGAAVWHTSSVPIAAVPDPPHGWKTAAGDRTVSASAIKSMTDTGRMSNDNIKSPTLST
jgi:hypothetical protein